MSLSLRCVMLPLPSTPTATAFIKCQNSQLNCNNSLSLFSQLPISHLYPSNLFTIYGSSVCPPTYKYFNLSKPFQLFKGKKPPQIQTPNNQTFTISSIQYKTTRHVKKQESKTQTPKKKKAQELPVRASCV